MRNKAEQQLDAFRAQSRFKGAVVDYRRFTGEFASASAAASVLAVEMVVADMVPASLAAGGDRKLYGKGVLVLGLGDYLTAVRILPS